LLLTPQVRGGKLELVSKGWKGTSWRIFVTEKNNRKRERERGKEMVSTSGFLKVGCRGLAACFCNVLFPDCCLSQPHL